MQRIKRIFGLIHIVLWILFSLLVALQLSQDVAQWFTLTNAVIITSLYVFYTRFILLTHYSGKKKDGAYYITSVAILVTGPLLYLFFHYKKFTTWDLFSEYYFISLLSLVVPFFVLSWMARITEDLVINTFKKEQLEKQAAESELHYLKSQINPHFLFNTLNNIHTLVYKQAPTAPEAVMQLASLMRYMIYESNAPKVSLTREIAYLQDYVSLQQLRYKANPVVDLRIDGEVETCYIAPLLFIHLLDNAYKHSPAALQPGDVKVTIAVKKDTLIFSIQNPVGKTSKHMPDQTGGIGLQNVRKRLDLLYPSQHSLQVNDAGETFTVILMIHVPELTADERKANVLHYR